jgi:hypothetical protein
VRLDLARDHRQGRPSLNSRASTKVRVVHVSALREVYVDLPVVLTSVDQSVGWAEREGPHRVIPLGSRPSDTELIEAIEVALGDQGMAV